MGVKEKSTYIQTVMCKMGISSLFSKTEFFLSSIVYIISPIYSKNIMFQNPTRAEKIDFSVEVLHKKAMRRAVFSCSSV